MTETRAQVIERIAAFETTDISANSLCYLALDAMHLLNDYHERERVLVEALGKLVDSIPGQTNDADWWPDELTYAEENAQQTLARINSGDWMDV